MYPELPTTPVSVSFMYKLTSENGVSERLKWSPGMTRFGDEYADEVTSRRYLHAYTHPILAVLLNPMHEQFLSPCIWHAVGDGVEMTFDCQVCCTKLTTWDRFPTPIINAINRIVWASKCLTSVWDNTGQFYNWQRNWESGAERHVATDINILEWAQDNHRRCKPNSNQAVAYNAIANIANAAWLSHQCEDDLIELNKVGAMAARAVIAAKYLARQLDTKLDLVKCIEEVMAA